VPGVSGGGGEVPVFFSPVLTCFGLVSRDSVDGQGTWEEHAAEGGSPQLFLLIGR
jgi:hypothetical protein